jgi:hypothetical protein
MSQPHADVPPEAESELLTAVELTRWLRITPRTVYQFVRNARSCTIPVRVISRGFPKWDRLLSIHLSAGLPLGDYRLTPRLAPVDGYTAPAERHSPRSRQVPTTHEVVATVAHGTSAPLSNSRPDPSVPPPSRASVTSSAC